MQLMPYGSSRNAALVSKCAVSTGKAPVAVEFCRPREVSRNYPPPVGKLPQS